MSSANMCKSSSMEEKNQSGLERGDGKKERKKKDMNEAMIIIIKNNGREISWNPLMLTARLAAIGA